MKITKLLVSALALCIFAISCQKASEDGSNADGTIIPRLASEPIATKGAIVTSSGLNIAQKEFLMNAWLGSANRSIEDGRDCHLIKNELVTCLRPGVWEIHNVYLWRKDVPTSFWCIYPTSIEGCSVSWPNNTASDEEQVKLSFDYTIPNLSDGAGAQGQPDICLAFSNKTWQSSANNYVDIDFKHALSAILFDITGVPEGISVVNIGFSGLKGEGKCLASGSLLGEESSKDIVFNWTPSGDNRSWNQNYVADDFEVVDDRTIIKADSEKIFMIIPQKLTEDSKIVVTFSDGGQESISRTVCIGSKGTVLAPGKKYTYKLSFKDGVLMADMLEEYNGSPLGGNIQQGEGLDPYNGSVLGGNSLTGEGLDPYNGKSL